MIFHLAVNKLLKSTWLICLFILPANLNAILKLGFVWQFSLKTQSVQFGQSGSVISENKFLIFEH